jgi:hypothetical protein
MNSWRKYFSVTRSLAIYAAVSLLSFLAASAPHRVHHFFDRSIATPSQSAAAPRAHVHADGEEHSHAPQPAPTNGASDCTLLLAAQHSHSLISAASDWRSFEFVVAAQLVTAVRPIASFNASPNSQRAPPLI